MSAFGQSGPTSSDVLQPILLRSQTPGHNEKVMDYLIGMSQDPVNNSPPESLVDHEEYREKAKSPTSPRKNGSTIHKIHSPSPRASQNNEALSNLEDLADSQVSYPKKDNKDEDGDDVDSNIQERSEAGDEPGPAHEPGPNDPPGPRYESYDSGPSFGNFGPLPTYEHPPVPSNQFTNRASNPFASTWQPIWEQPPKPQTEVPWNLNIPGLTPGGLAVTPGSAAKVPLPESVASPRPASVNIGVESPTTPRSRALQSQAASRISQKPSTGPEHEVHSPLTSPKAVSTTPSKLRGADGDNIPWSPRSGKSRLTAKTRNTDKGTEYPPLPPSVMEDGIVESPTSPTSPKSPKIRSKTPSVSPSDSPSQGKSWKSPLQPQRSLHGPTESDRHWAEFSPRSQSRQIPANSGGPGTVLSGGHGAEFSPRSQSRQIPVNGAGPGTVLSGGHQTRPFSPYRHAPTTEDLLHAAVRGRSVVESPERPHSRHSKQPSAVASDLPKEASVHSNGKKDSVVKPTSRLSVKSPSTVTSRHTRDSKYEGDGDATPTPSRPQSRRALNPEEERIVQDVLVASQTPHTSHYAPSTLETEIAKSHFHDVDLCILLQQENDSNTHEVVKKALRKAIRQRVKQLGLKHEHEIKQYRKLYHDHDPSVHLRPPYSPDDPPKWATDIKRELVLMQQRIESLGPKIEGLRGRSYAGDGSRYGIGYEGDEYSHTPMTQTVNIQTQPTGTLAESMFQPAETEIVVADNHEADSQPNEDGEFEDHRRGLTQTDGETRTHGPQSDYGMSDNRDDSPGQQFLEEELYKLRQKPQGSQSALSHRTWEVARDDDGDDDYDEEHNEQEHGASGLPTIPDSNTGAYTDGRRPSPPLPPIPQDGSRDVVTTPQPPWHAGDYSGEAPPLPPWQRIHQRLLSWAIIWPLSELDAALNSTTRGHQVDEVALSIWSTQTYKRYVRARLSDSPRGVVDRLFVPPNMADAISNAVFNGRHGDACGMLRDLWSPFGLEGMPRLLVVLAKHRSDENHWVVHRFSLPDGALTTYDSYPERTLPDGRPLGWWFAIRVAWPNAIYPSPDHLMQKMIRLHRPMQLPIDNSVSAAGIWRNILMGSRAERALDLERLRDLINTEVKNLRQRKLLGKLSIGAPRPTWEDMN